ncbi:30S ribosomal protein S20 [Candidatus Falkowbacteria bacterium]|nr:30S ribosomal protein S20 [Candidatus Falkowbacteria bacterium]
MAHTHHAIKDIRKTKKRALRNKKVNVNVKKLRKDTRSAIEKNNKKRDDLLKETLKTLDKAVQRGIVKKNTAARYKSRLMKLYNKNK